MTASHRCAAEPARSRCSRPRRVGRKLDIGIESSPPSSSISCAYLVWETDQTIPSLTQIINPVAFIDAEYVFNDRLVQAKSRQRTRFSLCELVQRAVPVHMHESDVSHCSTHARARINSARLNGPPRRGVYEYEDWKSLSFSRTRTLSPRGVVKFLSFGSALQRDLARH